MAITLLIQLGELTDYVAFYSSLLTSGRVDTIIWEEPVPLVLDQEARLIKQAGGAKVHAAKRIGNSGSNNKWGATSQPHPDNDRVCNHCSEPGHYWR